jgi:hypothetical protein
VGAGVGARLGEVLVVLEVVHVGRGDVPGVADAHLGDLVGLAHGLNGHLHLAQVVEAVEDAEHVEAVFGRQRHKLLDDVVRVARVPGRRVC